MHKIDPSYGFFPVNVKWKSTLKTKLSAVFLDAFSEK